MKTSSVVSDLVQNAHNLLGVSLHEFWIHNYIKQ